MKLCVTATGKELDSYVAEHFGQAPYFLIINTDTLAFEAIPNTTRTPERGGGASAAQLVLDKGVEAVLTGVIGPQALTAFQVAYVQVYVGASEIDRVREAINKFKCGEYKESTNPVGGPWHMEVP
ncbi:MAG: NifB/NifX family molybdenum-iron cluster-binding protein [bacterium]